MNRSKSFIVALAVLFAPALAMAQNVSLDTVGGTWQEAEAGTASSGMSTPAPLAAGTQLTLWTVLHTDTAIDGIQWALHVNGGADNGLFEIVGYAGGKIYDAFGGAPGTDGYGSTFTAAIFPNPADPLLWPVAEYTRFGGFPQAMGQNELMFPNTDGLKQAADIDGKTYIGYVVQNKVDLPEGTYDISINGPVAGSPTALWTSSPASVELTGAAYSIEVTPEPTSALLLLAAVPFLRRRRA